MTVGAVQRSSAISSIAPRARRIATGGCWIRAGLMTTTRMSERAARSPDMAVYEFVTVDVFTERRFGGNPLAVFPDAQGLNDGEMQSLAAEFNLSETTFVLPPADPANTARVRIFARTSEMPFAGHP